MASKTFTMTLIVLLPAALPLPAQGQSRGLGRHPAQHKARPVAHPAPKPAPLSIGISTFHQTVGTGETEALGIGITDSLANALKGSPSLTVAGPEVLSAASAKQDAAPSSNDENALRIGGQLGLMTVVVGAYQHVGDQLVVDGRILNVQTGAVLPGSSISVSGKYPEEYSVVLSQLAKRVMTALKLPDVTIQAQRIGAASMSSSSDALRLYNQGLQQMADGTRQSLEEAIRLFTECIKTDPAYALAYAARADAENKLIEASQAVGDDKDKLAQSALSDAEQAVKTRPNLPRAQTALARAYTTTGKYDQAVQAAEKAVSLSPNDGAAQIARSRARNQGQLVVSKDIAELMFKQPWIQYLFFYLPKVIVRNQSKFTLSVVFAPADGNTYPTLVVQPESARIMTVFAGKFNVDLDSDAGILKREYEFKGGEQYELIYRAEEIPLTRIIGSNNGNTPAYVTFDGPKKREFVINPGAREVFNVQAGRYHISCAGASGGSALQQRDDYLTAGGEYRYECDVTRTFTYRQKR